MCVRLQILLDELDQFRCDIAVLVNTERGLLNETLDEANRSIWCKVMDAYANNKSEMLNMIKLEIHKQLNSASKNVLLMTDALERDLDDLQLKLRHAQVCFSITTLNAAVCLYYCLD